MKVRKISPETLLRLEPGDTVRANIVSSSREAYKPAKLVDSGLQADGHFATEKFTRIY